MEMTLHIDGHDYAVTLDAPHDISIAITSDAAQLSVFGGAPASAEPLRAGGFIGDVTLGGSCNCFIHHFCAHTNGTHTEGIGHITAEATPVIDTLGNTLMPATLITVMPETPGATTERYDPAPQAGDMLITAEALEIALQDAAPAFLEAVVIRTLPNGDDKRTRRYDAAMPPYFTHEAMRFLLQKNVQHLLVDMPSIDRLADEGKLTNHRLFWDTPASRRTVTELTFVNNAVVDGPYLLNLGHAPFAADAAPSRPQLYELKRL